MKWYYSGEMTIHSTDGSWDNQHVAGVFDLPDSNVRIIREFLYSNRDFILECKYNPQFGDAPWGNVESQVALRSELDCRLPDHHWLEGVDDRQIKSYLVAFYHHVLENIDLYSPEKPTDKQLIAA